MSRPKKNLHERYNTTFPSQLRRLMAEKEAKNGKPFTHAMLGQALGFSRQRAGTYCDGSAYPDWETIVKIANYFNVSVDWILGNAPDNVRTRDATEAAILEYTGLSQEALNLLKYCKENKLTNEVNYILEHRFFFIHLIGHLEKLKEISDAYLATDDTDDFVQLEKQYIEIKPHRDALKDAGYYVGSHEDYISSSIWESSMELDNLMRTYIATPESRKKKFRGLAKVAEALTSHMELAIYGNIRPNPMRNTSQNEKGDEQ